MKKQNTKQIIGILGGMGPQASACLLEMLIDLSIKKFGAKNDDFPEILLDSVPVPDFISNDSRKNESLKILKNRVKFFNTVNPSCLTIACNTAHIFLNDLQKIAKVPFISVIEEVVKAVTKSGLRKVGILGTPTTIKSKLYQNALHKFGIKSIDLKRNELGILERIIRTIIAGSSNHKDSAILLSVANNLRERGAQGIILGCTELPLIFPKRFDIPVFNSLEILAKALLRN